MSTKVQNAGKKTHAWHLARAMENKAVAPAGACPFSYASIVVVIFFVNMIGVRLAGEVVYEGLAELRQTLR